MLNEEDVLFGLWKRRCAAEETRSALAHIQHGHVEAAQDVLLEAMHKQATGAYLTGTPSFNIVEDQRESTPDPSMAAQVKRRC